MKRLSARRSKENGPGTSIQHFSELLPYCKKMKHIGGWTIFAVLLACLPITSLRAQVSATASINGVVRDQSDAVVGGAQLTLTNTATGVPRMTVTGDTGRYVFVN